MRNKFSIPDKRSRSPEDYLRKDRRGQMKRSWVIGVNRRQDGRQTVSFRDGLTWGSIGQIMGYLLGEADDAFKNDLFERMLAQYKGTDRGALLAAAAPKVSLRVASWNLKYSAEAHSWRRSDFLKSLDWDIALLQEVSPKAWKVFQQNGLAKGGLFTYDGFDLTLRGRTPRGVAILVRNGLSLGDPQLISGHPQPERILAACVTGFSKPFRVVSFHAPHAVGYGQKPKQKAYQGLMDWLSDIGDLVIVGFDGNIWNRSTDLDQPEFVANASDADPIARFFAAGASHNLQDTLLSYYRQDSEAYKRALTERPNGPLAVSYVRGRKEDRFDYIFASPELEVLECRYDYDGAKAAGSDHGIVLADLSIAG